MRIAPVERHRGRRERRGEVVPSQGNEALCDEAADLLTAYANGQLRFIVPDLFWPELGNVLWKAVRQKRCSYDAAENALLAMRDRNLQTISSLDLLRDAFAIATAFDRTFYDSLYAALAVVFRVQFVTADERLANALAARLPVKWLGSV